MLTVITNSEANGTVGCAVRAKLVCNHDARSNALTGQQFTDEALGSLGIAAFLNEDFKYKTILINGATENAARH